MLSYALNPAVTNWPNRCRGMLQRSLIFRRYGLLFIRKVKEAFAYARLRVLRNIKRTSVSPFLTCEIYSLQNGCLVANQKPYPTWLIANSVEERDGAKRKKERRRKNRFSIWLKNTVRSHCQTVTSLLRPSRVQDILYCVCAIHTVIDYDVLCNCCTSASSFLHFTVITAYERWWQLWFTNVFVFVCFFLTTTGRDEWVAFSFRLVDD